MVTAVIASLGWFYRRESMQLYDAAIRHDTCWYYWVGHDQPACFLCVVILLKLLYVDSEHHLAHITPDKTHFVDGYLWN